MIPHELLLGCQHPSLFIGHFQSVPRESQELSRILHESDDSRCLAEEEGFWETWRSVTRETAVRGNLVPDAHLAALLRFHGVRRLYTHDRDYRRFDFLDVQDPLA